MNNKKISQKETGDEIIRTVAHMIALSNRTGCVVFGSKHFIASLKEQGLPIHSQLIFSAAGFFDFSFFA